MNCLFVNMSMATFTVYTELSSCARPHDSQNLMHVLFGSLQKKSADSCSSAKNLHTVTKTNFNNTNLPICCLDLPALF